MCCCAIGCQHSTLNRLFGCVFLVWRHYLRKVNKSLVCTFRRFFLKFSYFWMFLNIQIDLIILKTYGQQFTLTTKKSLHIIFNTNKLSFLTHRPTTRLMELEMLQTRCPSWHPTNDAKATENIIRVATIKAYIWRHFWSRELSSGPRTCCVTWLMLLAARKLADSIAMSSSTNGLTMALTTLVQNCCR